MGEAQLAGEAVGATEGLGGEGRQVVDVLRLPCAEQRLQQRIAQHAVVERLLQPVQRGSRRRRARTAKACLHLNNYGDTIVNRVQIGRQSEPGAPHPSPDPRRRRRAVPGARLRGRDHARDRGGGRGRGADGGAGLRHEGPTAQGGHRRRDRRATTSPCPSSTGRGPTPRGRPRPRGVPRRRGGGDRRGPDAARPGWCWRCSRAARTDPELAALATQLTDQRAVTARWLVDALAAHRATAPRAVDDLWLLMDPAIFDRLVRHRGWTPRRYERWFARSAACPALSPGGRDDPRPHRLPAAARPRRRPLGRVLRGGLRLVGRPTTAASRRPA